jgi:hypothetical protein
MPQPSRGGVGKPRISLKKETAGLPSFKSDWGVNYEILAKNIPSKKIFLQL